MSAKRETVSGREKVKEIVALSFWLFAIFTILSLLTYHESDIESIKYPPNDPVLNKGGRFGAGLAYFLYGRFGIIAFPIMLLAGYWAFKIFIRQEIKELYIKLLSAFVSVLALSTLMSLLFSSGFFGLGGTAPTAGGIYGTALERILRENFGALGTYSIVFLMLTTSILLSTDWLIYVWFLKGVTYLKSASLYVWEIINGWYSTWRIDRTHRQEENQRDKLSREIESEIRRVERDASYEERLVSPGVEAVPELEEAEPEVAPASLEEEAMLTSLENEIQKPNPKALARTKPKAEKQVQTNPIPYDPPPTELFEDKVERVHNMEKSIAEQGKIIEATLHNFQVEAKVVNSDPGPTITIYELELAPGIRYAKVVGLADDLAIALKAPNVRVVAPLPGKSTIGVEVPNPFPDIVRIREFLKLGADKLKESRLPLCLGKTNGGEPIVKSLTEMPHLLIAGTTGSGKSVCLNSIIMSLVNTMSPDDLKLLLIDPKMVELSAFKDLPHLWSPVLTDMKKAPSILDWLMKEMDDRYTIFSQVGVRNIETYNKLGKTKISERLAENAIAPEGVSTHLPYIVVVIDELADLMMMAAKEVEMAITRLSQKSRAVGIHLVVATQRPSVDVITGLIKSNMPARIAFKVAAKVDSRTILDGNGAERLLGKGDMLIKLPGLFSLIRAQCSYVSEKEIKDVMNFFKAKGFKAVYHDELVELNEDIDWEGTEKDELFDQAVEIVLSEQRGSVSLLQRRLSIGYVRASRLVDNMAKLGIVGEYKGANARDVLMTLEDWQALKQPAEAAGR